jgi:hypothetical protein
VVWWVWGGVVGGGFPLRSNIPRSALCATLVTYNFLILIFVFGYGNTDIHKSWAPLLCLLVNS